MVRILSSAVAIAALATSGLALNLPKRDVAKVESDLASISTQVTTLDKAITALTTSSSLLDALTVHNDAGTLATTVNSATTDVKAVPAPVAESDAQTILADVQAFQPTIIDALKEIVIKKPIFDGLPLGGVSSLVKQDLGTLNSSTFAFEAALIAAAPADLQSQATAIKTAIDAAFSTALAAYASA